MKQEWVKYCQNVLGITHLLRSSVPVSNVEPDSETLKRVLFVDQSRWSPSAFSLFEKMKTAMKLDPEQGVVIFIKDLSNSQFELELLKANVIVFFGASGVGRVPTENQFHVPSPEEMLSQPSLKKKAWETLQVVMASRKAAQ